MSCVETFYPESQFGGFTDIDGTITFYTRVNALLQPSFVILDIGCGRGAYRDDPIRLRKKLRIFKHKVKKVIGIDVDHTAAENPFIDAFYLITNDQWPLLDHSIDLILCDNVLEHVQTPDFFFNEINRILKPGGFLCLRTPNAYSYIALFAKLTPNKYHAKITDIVQNNRQERDVFPAYYRCNTIGKIRSRLTFYKYTHVVYGFEAEPSYLSFSKFAYWLGVLHQGLAPGFLKPSIFAFGQKK